MMIPNIYIYMENKSHVPNHQPVRNFHINNIDIYIYIAETQQSNVGEINQLSHSDLAPLGGALPVISWFINPIK